MATLVKILRILLTRHKNDYSVQFLKTLPTVQKRGSKTAITSYVTQVANPKKKCGDMLTFVTTVSNHRVQGIKLQHFSKKM